MGWKPAAYEQALKDEFDQLYEEGTRLRRMIGRKNPDALYRYHQEWVESLARAADAESARRRLT